MSLCDAFGQHCSTFNVQGLSLCRRALHIEQGFADPLVDCLRLQRLLIGIKRTQGNTSSLRLPVTDGIMHDGDFLCFGLESACFGQLVIWPISVSCAQQNLPSPTWLAFRSRSIWYSLMLQWIPCRLTHAYSFASRPQKPINFARAVFCTLAGASSHFVQFTLYWLMCP